MQSDKYAQKILSYIAGFSTYFILLLGILLGDSTIILSYITYFPGVIFAGLILLFTTRLTLIRALSFAIICCVIYYGEISVMISKHLDHELTPYYYLFFWDC